MRKQLTKIGSFFAIIGVVVALTLLLSNNNRTIKPQLLSSAEFKQQLSGMPSAVLIDVRTPAEFTSGHIDGAINIDFENPTFTSEVQKLDKTKTYFVYCRSGNRSAKAVNIMEQQGVNNIYELKNGIVSAQELL